MARKHLVLTILLMVLLIFLLSGCGSITADMTPTPDPSIVWSDDFEDGDMEGWGHYNPGEFFFVDEGVLTSGPDRAGDIYYESKVSSGTWSFDVFFTPDEISFIEFCLSCDQDYKTGFGFDTMVMKNTAVSMVIMDKGVKSQGNQVFLGKQLSGWNHFDVTRGDLGNTNVYLNGELILEYKDELNISPQWFFLNTEIIGPFFDNVVVRNQVIDIQLIE